MPYDYGWRQLVSRSIQDDVESRRANPGVQNFGVLVRRAMKLGEKKREAKREHGYKMEQIGAQGKVYGENVAKQAAYQAYPEAAAKELGVEVPERGQTRVGEGLPPGMRPSKVVYDEEGRPKTTYEAEETLTEEDLVRAYNDHVGRLHEQNAKFSFMEDYSPLAIPTFGEYKAKHFPGFGKKQKGGAVAQELSDTELDRILDANGLQVDDHNREILRKYFAYQQGVGGAK